MLQNPSMTQNSLNPTLPLFPETAPAARPLPALDRICVAIQAASVDELFARATEAATTNRFLELRLDSVPEPAAAIGRIAGFAAAHPGLVLLATCRRLHGHGSFAGPLPDELAHLIAAAQAGCRLVDLEIESAEEATAEQIEALRTAVHAAGSALLISFHDFDQTADVAGAYQRIARFRPEVVKVVSTAQSLADNLAILRLIEAHQPTTRVVGIAMGEAGLLSRVLGPRFGALFTFAAPDHGAGTAPGQASASTLRALYAIDRLGPATRVFGVAGNPIGHSLSPLMHNTAYAACGVDAIMLPLKVAALEDLLTVVRSLPLAGVAVTMPLKQQVLPYLAQMDPLVEKIGACNTLQLQPDGLLHGYNTDVAGVVRPLAARMQLEGARVAVLGAGGAARAAVFGLVAAGAQVYIVNRTLETAEKLALAAGAHTLAHSELRHLHFDVLLNTTPCGMKGIGEQMPLAEDELNANLVFDMIYNPLETPLLRLAKSRNLATISGVEMFVQQGAQQFEIWTGQPAPLLQMRQAVLKALGA